MALTAEALVFNIAACFGSEYLQSIVFLVNIAMTAAPSEFLSPIFFYQ